MDNPNDPSTASVTQWIDGLKEGDDGAAQKLWQRYCSRLSEHALKHLRGLPRRSVDEEDVAQVVFTHLCQDAESGKYPKLDDRDDLWQILAMLTQRKAVDVIRKENAQRRGGQKVRGESVFVDADGNVQGDGIAQIVDNQPTPQHAAHVAEECQRLLGLLKDAGLQEIAVWKMQGLSNAEIATRVGCVERTIERKLSVIRSLWQE